MKNRTLILIFAVLLLLYLASQLFKGNKQRSFDPVFLQVDTASVTSLEISPKEGDTPFRLEKEGGNWKLKVNELNTSAKKQMVNSLLGSIVKIEAQRITAKDPAKWSEYEVTEEGSNRLQAFAGNKKVADIVVGRFSMNPQTRSGTSYLRPADQNNVYAVDGFLSMSLAPKANSFRNGELLNLSTEEVQAFTLKDESQNPLYSIEKSLNGNWVELNGVPLDSSKTVQFMNNIKLTSGTEFFDEALPGGSPVRSLEVKKADGETVVLNAFNAPTNASNKPFVITSSSNPEAKILSDSTGIFGRVFKGIENFVAE